MTACPTPRLLAAALLIVGATAAAPAAAAPRSGDVVTGEVLVGLDVDSPAARAALERRTGVRLGARLTPRGARLARVPAPGGTPRALARLRTDPTVRWAEPNRWHSSTAVPADPLFPFQWALRNTGQSVGGEQGVPGADIRATEAWDLTTGDPGVRVAVLDGGVDLTAPDLIPNLGVVNPGESGDGREANGIDDDGNGLVDDWRGWDVVDGDADPSDEGPDRHGSTVAGVIAARGGDGRGIAGVNWSARLIPVRGLDAEGLGTTADLAAGITYAATMGARILNASFGGPYSEAIREAIRGAPHMLVVTAAGNGGPDGAGDDQDALTSGSRTYPCALDLENVVCVAATDQSDALAGFSNHGEVRVDVAAPGVHVIGPPRAGATTAVPLSGTSFAAPHVAGVAALVLATAPEASTRMLRRAVLDGAERLAALDGEVATGARLDAMGALAAVPPPAPGPGAVTGPAILTGPTSARLTGTVPGSSEWLAYHVEYGPTPGYGAATPTRPLPPQASARAVAADVDRLPGGVLHHRLVVHAVSGVSRGADATLAVPGIPEIPAPVAMPPGAAAPGAPGASGGRTRPASRPGVRVRRSGARWIVALTLDRRAAVVATVQRRRPAAARRAPRYANVRSVRRRTLAAGSRRIVLGRLAPGPHRLRVRLTVGRSAVVLSREFMVRRR